MWMNECDTVQAFLQQTDLLDDLQQEIEKFMSENSTITEPQQLYSKFKQMKTGQQVEEDVTQVTV